MPRKWSVDGHDGSRQVPGDMTLTGYDADEGVYYYRDKDGVSWQSKPGSRAGPFTRVGASALARPLGPMDTDPYMMHKVFGYGPAPPPGWYEQNPQYIKPRPPIDEEPLGFRQTLKRFGRSIFSSRSAKPSFSSQSPPQPRHAVTAHASGLSGQAATNPGLSRQTTVPDRLATSPSAQTPIRRRPVPTAASVPGSRSSSLRVPSGSSPLRSDGSPNTQFSSPAESSVSGSRPSPIHRVQTQYEQQNNTVVRNELTRRTASNSSTGYQPMYQPYRSPTVNIGTNSGVVNAYSPTRSTFDAHLQEVSPVSSYEPSPEKEGQHQPLLSASPPVPAPLDFFETPEHRFGALKESEEHDFHRLSRKPCDHMAAAIARRNALTEALEHRQRRDTQQPPPNSNSLEGRDHPWGAHHTEQKYLEGPFSQMDAENLKVRIQMLDQVIHDLAPLVAKGDRSQPLWQIRGETEAPKFTGVGR